MNSMMQSKFTFDMYLSVPSPQKEGIHIETHSTGHQGSKCQHLHHALCFPLPSTKVSTSEIMPSHMSTPWVSCSCP